MTNQPANPPLVASPQVTQAPKPSGEKPGAFLPIHRSWIIASLVGAIMLLLALLGIGLTTTNSTVAPTYWISLVPIYGVLCVGTAWFRKRRGVAVEAFAVLRQALHWLGIAVALGLDFYIRGTGEESGLAAGLNALLLLSLGCFLAGVHLEWLFAVVGALLALLVVCVAKADQYLWLVFVVGGLAAAALLGIWWFLGRSLSKDSAAPSPSL